MGHPLRLGNTTSAACRDIKSIMYVGDERRLPRGWAVQGADCDSAEREFEIDNPLDCDGDDSDHPDCQDDCTGDGEESGSSSIFDVDENGMLVFVGIRSSTSSTCPPPTPVNPCDDSMPGGRDLRRALVRPERQRADRRWRVHPERVLTDPRRRGQANRPGQFVDDEFQRRRVLADAGEAFKRFGDAERAEPGLRLSRGSGRWNGPARYSASRRRRGWRGETRVGATCVPVLGQRGDPGRFVDRRPGRRDSRDPGLAFRERRGRLHGDRLAHGA